MHLSRKLICILIALACVAAGVRFVTRGPLPSVGNSCDFAVIYTASRAWLAGHDPYEQALLTRTWKEAGGPARIAPNKALTPSVYPPTTFVLISPFTLVPWPVARVIWCGVNILAIGVLLEAVRRLANFSWIGWKMPVLAACVLAMRPFSGAVAVGQLSIVVTAIGTLALLATARGRGRTSALLCAIAVAIKAPLAAAFVAPDFMALRWKAVALIGLFVVAIGTVGLLRLNPQDSWKTNWRDNLRSSVAIGGVNDASPANPHRYQLLNLQYPLSTYISTPLVADSITWVLAGIMITPALIRLKAGPTGSAILLPLGLVSVVEIFAFYHRMYDAVPLIFPFAWALLATTPGWQRWPTLLLLASFILPGASGDVTGSPRHIWLWEHFVLPRDACVVLLLGGWLAYCQWTLLPQGDLNLES